MKFYRITLLALIFSTLLPVYVSAQDTEKQQINSLTVGENCDVLQSGLKNSILIKAKSENILVTSTHNFENALITEIGSSTPLKFIVFTHAYSSKTEQPVPDVDENRDTTLVFQENSYIRFSESFKADVTVVTVGNRLTVKTGNEEIEIFHLPGAHTDGDLAVYLKNANLLYTGNLFYPDSFPYIDLDEGGTVKGYLDALNEIIKISNKDTVIVPSRGDVSDRKKLEDFQKMFKNSKNRIELLTIADKSLQEITDEKPLNDFIERWENGNISSRDFIRNLYEGIKKKK